MKEKRAFWPLVLFAVVFAITRVPGLLPPNFSAAYALFFCAGALFTGAMAWWYPLGLMVLTDLALNAYYQFVAGVPAFSVYSLVNYAAFAALILLGRSFKAGAQRARRTPGGMAVSWLKLTGGGVLGAIVFYILTNTAAWLFNPFNNPEYSRDLPGWILALTKGTGGYPQTWEFFRNSLLGGGLFTGLFVGAMKLAEAPEPEEQETEAPEPAAEPEPEEAKA